MRENEILVERINHCLSCVASVQCYRHNDGIILSVQANHHAPIETTVPTHTATKNLFLIKCFFEIVASK